MAGRTEVRAIAVDRETALLVDPDGEARVIANASHPTPFVYFLHTPGPPEQCAPGTPLAYRNIPVYRLGPQGSFNLPRWSGTGGVEYLLTAEDGRVRRSGPGEVVSAGGRLSASECPAHAERHLAWLDERRGALEGHGRSLNLD